MALLEEIIEFIGNGKTFDEILNHFDENKFSLNEKLRSAEVRGFLIRKKRKNIEIWAS